jgi:hypothetical protein
MVAPLHSLVASPPAVGIVVSFVLNCLLLAPLMMIASLRSCCLHVGGIVVTVGLNCLFHPVTADDDRIIALACYCLLHVGIVSVGLDCLLLLPLMMIASSRLPAAFSSSALFPSASTASSCRR